MALENGFPRYPDFLKIFNSHEHSQRLVIPSGYNKYYPNPLPQTAVLKKPEGNFWTVKWTISQDETISFQEGWEKFVKDNGVIDRDFLLFTYDGSRSFWVRIHRNGLPVEPNSPIKIQEISDDEGETTGEGDHHMEEGDSHKNMIVSLSLGTSDDDDDYEYEDDEDTSVCEVDKASGSSKRGMVVKKKRADIDPMTYLDDPQNPHFVTNISCSTHNLVISTRLIKDYELKFNSTINLIDDLGELKTKISKRKDRVAVLKCDVMYKRNKSKQGDLIVCEILREGDVVRAVKVHFVKK